MKKEHILLLVLNLIIVTGFAISFILRLNYEFVIYVGVILICLLLLVASRKIVDYSYSTLIGLSVWSTLHMAGGGIYIGKTRLYDIILIPLLSQLPVLRYDQMVHIWGFGICVLLSYDIIKSKLANPSQITFSAGLILVMAALGFGALNEILEFGVSLVVESGVGDYLNTSLDLCSDLVGAIIAVLFLATRSRKKFSA